MTRFGAVTFDAMGTLVAIEPPAPRLQRSLERRLRRTVDLARCEAAMRVEMRHYGAHCISAHDAPSLAALRLECASLLADALALDLSGADVLPSLTDAISFYAFPDAQPAIERLAEAGVKLAVVANWDVSLHDVLERVGLARGFEAVVTAAAVGAAKPDPGRSRSRSSVWASRPRSACTSATTRPRTSRGRRGRACPRCSSTAAAARRARWPT